MKKNAISVYGQIIPESEIQAIIDELGYMPSQSELEVMYYYEFCDCK